MTKLALLALVLVGACASDPFTFTIEVSGITDEVVKADGVVQTATDGKVTIKKEFDSWYDTMDPLPPAVQIQVAKGSSAIVTKAFTPGLSCSGHPMTWDSERADVKLGTTPEVSCHCKKGSDTTIDGTCPDPN